MAVVVIPWNKFGVLVPPPPVITFVKSKLAIDKIEPAG